MTVSFGLDVGSNSLGSAWIDHQTGEITVGLSIFPAGVDESDEKRGDPKNAKRRMVRRARITLARRAQRKRLLRLKLISVGLLPSDADEFKTLLQETDPWLLRGKGLTQQLTPHQFGRVLLHLAQRRGAMGFDADVGDTGAVKKAIVDLQLKMLERFGSAQSRKTEQELRGNIESLSKKKSRTDQEDSELDKAQEELSKLCKSLLQDNTVTFGRFIADLRDERRTPITTKDNRKHKNGPREWRQAVRNKAGEFKFHADRAMIRDEFTKLWDAQKRLGGSLAAMLTDDLRLALDDETRNSDWRHKGLLFGQRMQTWDLGTLGRCVLEPTERCAPHADMDASRYLVVETVNNLKIIERGQPRSLTPAERSKIKDYLSGPLGVVTKGKQKGQSKRTVTVSDLRDLMDWGIARTSPFHFNIESDEERLINTDWFSREIIHGAVTPEKWEQLPERSREGINRAILKHDPDDEKHAAKLKALVMQEWAGLSEAQADVLVAVWKKRPRPDANRLSMSRRAVRKLLTVMDRDEPWPDEKNPGQTRWLDQNTARRLLAKDAAAVEQPVKIATNNTENAVDEQNHHPKHKPTLSDEAAEGFGRELETETRTRKAFVRAMRNRGVEPDGHPNSDYFRVLRAWEKAKDDRVKNNPKLAAKLEADRVAAQAGEIKVKLQRYASGTKGATARDRHYIKKHLLKKNKELVYDPDGLPLHEPPPAPLISNPVVRKAIHEVRRHIVEFLTNLGRKPDEIHVELSREAKMGKVDADRLLFRNRLRNRIRNDIINEFNLSACSSTQQRAAVERVVLAVQQNGVCPLCGNQTIKTHLTPRMAANPNGGECEVAHIVPKGSGGHNGLGNVVLAHRECNRNMARRTPREFWNGTLKGKFEEGISWIEKLFGEIDRPKFSEIKNATGNALWLCYFNRRDDLFKIEQFKKNVKDIQEMTARQGAATKYAARQVMTYLADALFDGKGLPERSTGSEQNPERRRIFANDGLWTSRLRREWGLFFDRHGGKAHGLTSEQEHERKEKNRGDHRHHAIDAIVIALCTEQVRRAWDAREQQADQAGINTADEEAMDKFREQHRLDLPSPFKSRQQLRDAIQRAVFGEGTLERPVAHRPVKRKLIGALHKEILFGPVVDKAGRLTENYTDRKSVLELTPNHLRVPAGWDELSEKLDDDSTPEREKRTIRKKLASMSDPSPNKSGIVRDRTLRDRFRKCLRSVNLDLGVFDPKKNVVRGGFTTTQLTKAMDAGAIKQKSGVPIYSFVLLRTMGDAVITSRWATDYKTGQRYKVYDANTGKGDAAAARAYDGRNNHHIEIRVAKNKKGDEVWTGEVVTGYQAAQRKLAKLRAFKDAGIPKLKVLRKLSKVERAKFKTELRRIEKAHPIVDRSDNDEKGGKFVMSLCEGETLKMKHKKSGEVGYFVVAELVKNKKQIVLVPHWDARKASKRKDAEGKEVPDSMRDEFMATLTDLKELSPPDHPHAVKVRVSALGEMVVIND